MPGPTPPTDLDAAVDDVRARRETWVLTPVAERIGILDEMRRDVASIADRWVAASVAAEGLDPDRPESGEESVVGPYFLQRNIRLLRDSLREIERHGAPRVRGPVRTRADGQVTARAFPRDLWDRLLYLGVSADVWMEPGVTADELPATQALAYREPDDGGVVLILGAGNVSSIAPMDALYKLFVENRVVVLKLHPVLDHLGPVMEVALRSLTRRGVLRLVHGGADVGAYLCRHPGVDEIHVTGAGRTYDAIVFGSGEEGRARQARGERVIDKRVTAELGNVSPVIVVPGPWSDADVAYHAENLVTTLANNAGFNCVATRVIVQHAAWDRRERLLDAIRTRLAEVRPRAAFYPGARDRYDAFLAAHPDAEQFGQPVEDELSWALAAGLDPTATDDTAFTTESFCGVFAETALDAPSVADFVDRAVEFANETVWGSLSATLIVHPASLRDPAVGAAVERAIATLRYGTVSLNHWSAIGYGLVVTPWGAYPGHRPEDIRSGTGVVHNTLMFSRTQKAVVRAPFRAWPKPLWFTSHRTAHRLTPLIARFEAVPSPTHLPRIFALAILG